jgi:hypothetical protein
MKRYFGGPDGLPVSHDPVLRPLTALGVPQCESSNPENQVVL